MNIGSSGGLSPKAEKLIRGLSTLTVLGLAVAAAILSFAGLEELSLKAGISHSIAWLLPVIIDGMVLTGSLGVVSSSLVGIGTWYPWTLTILGVSASIAGNVAIAAHNLSARLVHAAGPIAFALSIEGLLRIYRASATATVQREKDKAAKEDAEYEKEMRSIERANRREQKRQDNTLGGALRETPVRLENVPVVSSEPKESVKKEKAIVPGSTKNKVRELWLENKNITGGEVARTLNLDPSYARKTLRELREKESSLVENSMIEGAVSDAPESSVDGRQLSAELIVDRLSLGSEPEWSPVAKLQAELRATRIPVYGSTSEEDLSPN